ncbi:interleukin-7 receptor subunit alpha [Brachyhypopomus gauderio]|uniref:interleukin-7 receptor subunit alpha n=1 Tax=Brachyhypopomus gauderio TaxID=698409 RepID=UPI004042DB0F
MKRWNAVQCWIINTVTGQQMAYVLWILSILCPFSAYSDSGDYDDTAQEVFCSSSLTFKQSDLTCFLASGDTDDIEFASLCSDSVCSNGTLGRDSFSFENLSILGRYKLKTHFKEGEVHVQDISLAKMVKIPTPEIVNATFKIDEAVIVIKYNHIYVTNPEFEMQIRGKSINKTLKIKYQQVTIGKELLTDSGEYYVRVRAKPIDYFNGSWTNWSPEKSFLVNSDQADQAPIIILLCTTVVVLIVIWLVVLQHKEIKAFISPNVPHPKDTLAQIHRLKEHPPVSFSPEMFSDVNINRVDYTEEMHLTPVLSEGHTAIIGRCTSGVMNLKCSRPASLTETQDRDDLSLEAKMSHLKLKLLDQTVSAEEEDNNVGCQSLAALHRDYKDETYVTMSSLYKTQ